jgi:hypothetical protein
LGSGVVDLFHNVDYEPIFPRCPAQPNHYNPLTTLSFNPNSEIVQNLG